jgi:predicted permease
MIRHNLILIYRNIKRFKSIFFINLIGLSTGLACTLLIYLWVNDELSIDAFHKNGDRLYYAWEHRIKADGIWTSPNTSGPTADALIDDYPEIEYTCSATRPQPFTLSVAENTMKVNGRYAGKDFFNVFSYDVVQGDKNKILSDNKSIAISESLALKFFHTTDNVIGKMIEIEHQDQFAVSGVFKDLPVSSSEQFEFLLPWEHFYSKNNWVHGWGSTGTATYVLLKQGTDIDALNKKVADLVKVKTNQDVLHRTVFLKKYADIYLKGEYENGVIKGGRITYVKLFSMIAIFILIIACINFMNLSTAKASRRVKEVGIKKAIGAGRTSLAIQYLAESLFMSFLSMAVAVLLVDILLGQFNEITGKHLQLHLDSQFILTAASISMITGIFAGSYPALYLSSFRPAAVLKGQLSSSFGEMWARKGLVVFQFALSVILIVSVMVVYKQIEFVQSASLGYNRDNILYFYKEGKAKDPQYMETMLEEIKRIPGVVNASTTNHNMTGHNSGTSGLIWDGKDPEDHTEFENIAVNFDMMETWGIKMAAGRMFSRSSLADTAKIIISERGIKFMGLKDPIGATVKLWGDEMQIIGISKDFHYESLHQELKPLFFRLARGNTHIVMIKVSAENQDNTIQKIKTLYTDMNPGFSFDYQFLDEKYQSQYIAEQRVSTISRYFAGLAILLSCLGLFGLTAFTAERRLKEIGIRKILGSSEFGIVYLLSSDFTKIVLISIVIALPASYFMSQYWLSTFAFRIPLTWWYFISAGAMALFIAWATVALQAFKAARVNPTKCLKEE